MARVATVPTDVGDARVMRAWYQSLKTSLEGVVLSVKDFGAAGNGSIDDTAAFTRALAFASSNQNALYIPAGNYKITDGFILTSAINIYGEGPQLSIIEPHFDAADTYVFSMTAGGGLNIFDLGFDGTSVSNPSPTNNVHIIEVDPTTGTLDNINVHNVKFSNLTMKTGAFGVDADADLRATHCIFLDNVDHVTIFDCQVDTVSGAFVYAQYVNHINVIYNHLKDVGWYPIHLEARVRFFNIESNYINQDNDAGSIFGGLIDVLEDTTVAIPTSGTDPDRIFYNNGIIHKNYMDGSSAYPSIINVLSASGVTIKDNIINGMDLGTQNGSDSFVYNIHVGTRAASTTLFYGPPINIIIDGNMIRSSGNGGDYDYGIRVDNNFQSASVGTSRRPIEHVIVKNNIIGFNLWDNHSTYSDINIDKGIYFDGGFGGMYDITCEDNSIMSVNTAQSATDGAGVIDFIGASPEEIDSVKIGGNRIRINGSATGSTVVGINISARVQNVVNTKPNFFKDCYTVVETATSGLGQLYYLDDQVVESATDPYIFGTALTEAYHNTLSGNTASRPAAGKNRTNYMIYYDTDEARPLYWDSSAWVNALGDAADATYVDTTGTPADNQLAIFTDADTLEGDANLTYDGTNLDLGASDKISFNTVDILSDAAGTMTLSNIDAIDATTETTLEDAIDSLANLTTVGTITSGTWQGTTVAVDQGGTGATTLTDGGVLLGSGTGAITAMGALSDGEMIVGDGTTDPVAESGATLRTSIGVAIGSDVQAYDADLDTLSTAFTTASASGAASLAFAEDTDNGSNAVTLIGPASTADVTLTLPAATDTLMGKATTDTLTNKTFDANGTGNSLSNVDLTADVTGVLPEANGGIGVAERPRFKVTLSANQNISDSTFTKIQFDTETFDIGGDFDSTTNYRHTPGVAGKYLYILAVHFTSAGDQKYIIADIWKNGVRTQGTVYRASGTAEQGTCVATIVDMNGSTDYIEGYVFQDTGSTRVVDDEPGLSNLSGSLITG